MNDKQKAGDVLCLINGHYPNRDGYRIGGETILFTCESCEKEVEITIDEAILMTVRLKERAQWKRQ